VPSVRLLTSYDDTVNAIVWEMDHTVAGDRIEFSVYVLEPGASTQRVLSSMQAAATRGVRVHCSLDCSVITSFTRWCEGTATLASELVAMESAFPGLVRFSPQTIPTHAKYVMCHRADRAPTAIFGGVNIGDRFKPWRDFAIRAEGKAIIGALSLNINGPMGSGISGGRGRGRGEGSGVAAAARSARELLRQGVSLSVGSRHRVCLNPVSLTLSRLLPILANRGRDFMHGSPGIDRCHVCFLFETRFTTFWPQIEGRVK